MASAIKAVVFDLWNTLIAVDAKYAPYPRIAALFRLQSVTEFRDIMRSDWMTSPDLDIEGFYNHFCRRTQRTASDTQRSAFRRIWDEYLDHVAYLPSTLATLEHLRSSGIKIGVLANTVKPSLDSVAPALGLRDAVDVMLPSYECGFLKPDPRFFKLALERLDSEPEESVIVGDNLRTDILAGLILGTHTVLYDHRFTEVVIEPEVPVSAIVPRLEDVQWIPAAITSAT